MFFVGVVFGCVAGQYDNIYYVTPNSLNTSCPSGYPCYELETYIRNASLYFTSNTSFVFLPGIHVINEGDVITIENIINFQFQGSGILLQRSLSRDIQDYGFNSFGEEDNIPYLESSTRIACSHASGFLAFNGISNLSLINITVLNCGGSLLTPELTAAVHVVSIYNLVMDGVTIKNSTGYGLLGRNVLGSSKIARSSFVGNNQAVKEVLNRQSCRKKRCGRVHDGCTICRGGNVLITYTDDVDDVELTHHVSLTSGLYALGFDPTSIDIDDFFERLQYLAGAGISILMSQSSFKMNITIDHSISYRNHAQDGPNMLFTVIYFASYIAVRNISSARGEITKYGTGDTVLFVHTSRAFDQILYIADTVFKNSRISIFVYGVVLERDRPGLILVKNIKFLNSIFRIADERRSESTKDQYLISFEGSHVKDSRLNIETTQTNISDCIFSDTSIFVNDSVRAKESEVFLNGNNLFEGSLNALSVFYIRQAFLHITGTAKFSNCRHTNGGVIHMDAGHLIIHEMSNVTFANNHALSDSGGAIYMMEASRLKVLSGSNLTFVSNKAVLNGGAIYMHFHSSLTLMTDSLVYFTGNNAYLNGGAIFMDNSSVNISPQSGLVFADNVAYLNGGAIYVQDPPPSKITYDLLNCFLQGYDRARRFPALYFTRNYAGEAGSVIYGGNIEKECRYSTDRSDSNGFDDNARIGFHNTNTSLISSDPLYICPCGGDTSTIVNTDLCSTTYVTKAVYPGQTVTTRFVTVGQRNGTAPAIVLSYKPGDGMSFLSAFRSSKQCEQYQITYELVNSTQYLITQALFTAGGVHGSFFNVSIHVLPCPSGFVLHKASQSCVCDPLLQRHGLMCNISDLIIRGTQNKWIGYTSQHVLGFCTVCPYDYCTEAAEVNVLDLDSQCGYGRHRVLCGQCKDGQSMSFGTSQCKVCTNYYLFMIVPFAIMGITLVLVLFLLNLTVTSGTLNGLLFYANIVRINDSTFFPKTDRHFAAQFLATFVAWLNLDFGIETCFYDGMDSYAKTWLEFAFPTYIFALLGAIIIAGRCSSKISRLCRQHVIPVLSTLILLSYSKILKTIITILSFAIIDIEVSNNTNAPVWLYDGNVEFLGPKHIALFAFGLLILLAFIIPYTTMLLFLPCLQSKSYLKALVWVNKLKPFLDSYAAPYKDRYRFWGGVLLLVRLPLYLLFSLTNNVSIHLLGILIFVNAYCMILIGLSLYKKWSSLSIDVFFQLNLIVLSIARLFDPIGSIREPIASLVLMGVASVFVCFILIVAFHIYLRSGRVMPRWNLCEKVAACWNGNEPAATHAVSRLNVNHNEVSNDLRETLLHDI